MSQYSSKSLVIQRVENFPWNQSVMKCLFLKSSSKYSKHKCPNNLMKFVVLLSITCGRKIPVAIFLQCNVFCFHFTNLISKLHKHSKMHIINLKRGYKVFIFKTLVFFEQACGDKDTAGKLSHSRFVVGALTLQTSKKYTI